MDITADLIAAIQTLQPERVRERLAEIRAEEKALLTLLRSVQSRRASERRRQAEASPVAGEAVPR